MHKWFADKPFMTASAFSVMPFLDRWARGEGGLWLNMVEDFIERKKRQGIRALRVFDETTDWHDRDDNPDNDHGFFNESRATSQRMWPYHALRRQARPHRLTTHHQVMLLKLFELARKHQMKIELVVDATLKHSPGVGWLVIGHCVRQVADFVKNVHRGNWVDVRDHDEGGMGSPNDDGAHERIRQRFEAVKGPLDDLVAVETDNEADAHSQGSWRAVPEWADLSPGKLREKAFAEVNARLRRMREDESHWPEGACWVSQGGNDGQGADLFEYDHRLADAIAFHPERPNMDVGGRFDHILAAAKREGIAAYANEIIHGVGDSWWWTVEQGIFRPRSSTKDHQKRRRFIGEMMERGIYVCDHSLENMACGYWVDNGWHRMEETEFEKILLSEHGGVEPPPPTRMRRYERVIDRAYEEILSRDPDEGGLDGYNEAMHRGMSEAQVREALIRSDEYEERNPEQ